MEKPIQELPHFILTDTNLDDIVDILQLSRNEDVNLYFDFLGHKLYSDSVTLESAYQEVYGMTRAEYRNSLITMIKEEKRIEDIERNRFAEVLWKQREKIDNILASELPPEKIEKVNEIISLLIPLIPCDYDDIKIRKYIELIKKLDTDDYDLMEIVRLYNEIKYNNIIANSRILRNIRDVSKHGNLLFEILYDGKAESECLATEIRLAQYDKDYIPISEKLSHADITAADINIYDRRKTTHELIKYQENKSNGRQRTD